MSSDTGQETGGKELGQVETGRFCGQLRSN